MLSGYVNVLVVEDNPGDARLIQAALVESQHPIFRVSFATTLAGAENHLRDNGTATNVILLDLSLPDVTGEATVVRMREAAPDLPIVIMSGLDDDLFAERAVALGAQDYLVKGAFTGPMLWRAITYAVTRMQLSIERESLVNELRATIEIKNKMMGILAHDLRNPIGAISGYAEFLEMTEAKTLSQRMVNSLQVIRESATFMNNLMEEVLSLAVADAGEIVVNRQRINLGTLARQAAAITAMAAEKKQIRLKVEAETVWIEGDGVKLEQVLNNLIVNAIKFSKPGDVITVSVPASDARGKVLCVSDQGTGISPDVMANLFQPFVKGKAGTAGEQSNGLGLYICSRIVAAHGGTIEVDSKEGGGASFTIILPAG